MGINIERMRALLEDLEGTDPDAEVRRQVIAGPAHESPLRARAVALLSADLLRDPSSLMVDPPPKWLSELAERSSTGTALLIDSRLTVLAGRAVDDVVAQGCPLERLVPWLEDRRAGATPARATVS